MLNRLLAAATLARTADAASGVVLVLASVEAYDSPAQGAVVLSALLIPHVVAGPFVGLVTDRARSQRLAHAGFVGMFGVSLGAALFLLGHVPLAVVAGIALVAGTCGSMVFGGLSSRLDDVVPAAKLPRARGLDSATYNLAEITGPALAAVLVSAAGVPVAATAITVSCLSAAVVLLGVRSAPAAPAGGAPRAGVKAAVTAIVTSRPLRAGTVASGFQALSFGMFAPIAVVLAGTRGGFLVTALGVGALTGSLLVARFPVRRWPPHVTVSLCLFGAGLAFAGLWAQPPWPVLLAVFAVAGLFDGPVLASVLDVRAREAPPGARTQVFTIGAGVKLTAASAGAAAFTLVADAPHAVLVAVLPVSHLIGAAAGLLLARPARHPAAHSSAGYSADPGSEAQLPAGPPPTPEAAPSAGPAAAPGGSEGLAVTPLEGSDSGPAWAAGPGRSPNRAL